jgi:hypothetical protein
VFSIERLPESPLKTGRRDQPIVDANGKFGKCKKSGEDVRPRPKP